jgi:pyruvate kinase
MRATHQDLSRDPKRPAVRKTKIIATVGPSCWSRASLEAMVDAGMDVARFNFSHGTLEQHVESLQLLRAICREKGRTVAAMMDLQGPQLRTSWLIDHATSAPPLQNAPLYVGVGAVAGMRDVASK